MIVAFPAALRPSFSKKVNHFYPKTRIFRVQILKKFVFSYILIEKSLTEELD